MAGKLPLAVDLDGTLIYGDLFTRAMLQLARQKPWLAPALFYWLGRGRAYAKAQLTRRFPVDAARLPYNEDLVAWLREERAAGRLVALATAFDRAGAEAVAAHLGVFDRVFASDGRANMKSHRKAAVLAAAFPQGFVYAGNESADLAVWRRAAAAIVVNAPPWLERRAAAMFIIERAFPRKQVARAGATSDLSGDSGVKP